MSFGSNNQLIVATPTGRIDSAFLNGQDGSDIAPSWNTSSFPDLTKLVTGVSFSVDLANYLTDPGSPSSQLGFYNVSGQKAVDAGFVITGTVLSNACSVPTSGVFQLVAVRNNVSVLSAAIIFSITSASTVDNVAPTIPTGITAVPGSAVGTISCSFDSPCDVASIGVPASGTAHVDCYVNGSLTSPPSPIIAPTNALITPTLVNIGNITTPALPAYGQVSNVWTLTAAGTGIASTTAEQCLFLDFGKFTGNQHIIAQLDSYTSTSATALMGLMMHETGVSGGKFLAIGMGPSNGTVGLYLYGRSTAGAASTLLASLVNDKNGQPIIGPIYVKLERISSTQLTVSYSHDQLGWTLWTTQTFSLATTTHDGIFITSQTSSSQSTGSIEELAVTTSPTISTIISSTSTVPIQFRSVDANGNTSALSATVIGTPKIASQTGSVRFHALSQGGFYAYFNNNSYAGSLSQATAFLNRSDIANIAGIQIYFRLGEMQVTKGDYSTTIFPKVDNLVSLCAAKGKRLAFGVWDRGFGTSNGTSGGCAPPNYMLGGTSGGPAGSNAYTCWAANGSSFGGVNSLSNYASQTMLNDQIALYQALGDRYNNNPTVECFIWFGETSLNPSGPAPNALQWSNAIVQIANAIAPHWPNTQLRLETNFVPGSSAGNVYMTTWLQLMDATATPMVVVGGPDPVGATGFGSTANGYFTGISGPGTDRRGKNVWWSECQLNGVGGSHSLFPGGAAGMIAAQAAQGAYYFSVNAADNTDTIQFNRDMLPAINAVNGRLQSVLPSAGNWNQG